MGLEQSIVNAVIEGKLGAFLDGGMILIPRNQVDRFLDWLEGKGTLLGAEGFQFDGIHLIPDMSCIIDYSHGDPAKSIEFHRKVIAENPEFQKVHFIEFVFADE